MNMKTLKNYMITSALVFAGSIATIAYKPAPANAFGVGVQPSTVEMTVKPGERQRQVVKVGNVHKTKTISLTLGLADWSLDKNGKLVLIPPGESERSAANWIRFSPASVTLKPETVQDVTVEISVPFKVRHKGDHRFALLATTMLPELNERGDVSGVWNRYQLASLFYLTLTPAQSKPEIKNVGFSGGKDKALTFDIVNQGDAHARLKGNAYFKSKDGKLVGETPLSTVVLDKGEREYVVSLENVEGLKTGETYDVNFDLKNSFTPQNKFKAQDVAISPIQITMP